MNIRAAFLFKMRRVLLIWQISDFDDCGYTVKLTLIFSVAKILDVCVFDWNQHAAINAAYTAIIDFTEFAAE